MKNIRNFSIIAHIDHGKSTLADRMLELTHTVEKRHMREQVLDSMDLERERGITIKMQPVRMVYHPDGQIGQISSIGQVGPIILNLIDTPGHIDFSYEVSRALKAVEGSILLVDATQGVQAQTLTTLNMACEAGLVILPVVSKIDSPLAETADVKQEIASLLEIDESEILEVSGKTGEGVGALLDAIIERVPSPKVGQRSTARHQTGGQAAQRVSVDGERSVETYGAGRETKRAAPTNNVFRSLVFDFEYSNHKGVIVFVRVFGGEVKKGDKLEFKVAGESFQALEVGILSPGERSVESLGEGEIGYIVTGIKEPGVASVGDTVAGVKDDNPPFPGYERPKPVVWASIYPESQDDFVGLRQALLRLQLSDSSFTFEEEASGIIGRGFRCGFLGMLHLEIVTERLRREFDLPLIITLPSITYNVTYKTNKQETIYTPSLFPEAHLIESVEEPWVKATIIIPPSYMGQVLTLLYEHEGQIMDTKNMGTAGHFERTSIEVSMPLRELMRGFFDKLKSATSGFGSVAYEVLGERKADVVRLDILVADEEVPAFAKVVARHQVEREAETSVEKLAKLLPRQMFSFKVQAKAGGRIISSRSLSGMKKDVTQHMYGGDITRKMKLREKQKKGKKKMKERGNVNIPQDVFLKMMKSDN